ncbi:MAG: hypothetical protein HDQ88_07300 [Clostridia bacterium]|nr:hypothetical protein [Clostridia bacterium]
MKTLINVSTITDYSGEPPIITYSNPVTTVVNDPSAVIITRYFYCLPCDCCRCYCNCCDCCCN